MAGFPAEERGGLGELGPSYPAAYRGDAGVRTSGMGQRGPQGSERCSERAGGWTELWDRETLSCCGHQLRGKLRHREVAQDVGQQGPS